MPLFTPARRWQPPYYGFKREKASRRALAATERVIKGALFGCRMCGNCMLQETAFICPMECPKGLRNGPCGGGRANGNCEVIPELPCIWVQAYERSRAMPIYGEEIRELQPPVNRSLHNTSAWINMFEGIDKQVPTGWVPLSEIDIA